MTGGPKYGDEVHATFAGRYLETPREPVVCIDAPVDHATGLPLARPALFRVSQAVRVEKAPRRLPTEPGSLILAKVSGEDRPDLLVLRPVTDSESDEVTRWPTGSLVWESNGNGWIDPPAIQPGWVQIDPSTLLPVETS